MCHGAVSARTVERSSAGVLAHLSTDRTGSPRAGAGLVIRRCHVNDARGSDCRWRCSICSRLLGKCGYDERVALLK